jgi:MFS superfamily sulfate permease-like transporter
MYYANMRLLEEEIMDLVNSADPPLRWFCIDASAVDDVDYSAAETIRSLHRISTEKGIHLVVAQVLEDVKAASSRHMRQLFGGDALFDTLGDVIKEYQRQTATVTKG